MTATKTAKLAISAAIAIAIGMVAPQMLSAQANASVQVSATVVSADYQVSQSEVAATAQTYLNRVAASANAATSIPVRGAAQVRAERVAQGAESRNQTTMVVLEYAAN